MQGGFGIIKGIKENLRIMYKFTISRQDWLQVDCEPSGKVRSKENHHQAQSPILKDKQPNKPILLKSYAKK